MGRDILILCPSGRTLLSSQNRVSITAKKMAMCVFLSSNLRNGATQALRKPGIPKGLPLLGCCIALEARSFLKFFVGQVWW